MARRVTLVRLRFFTYFISDVCNVYGRSGIVCNHLINFPTLVSVRYVIDRITAAAVLARKKNGEIFCSISFYPVRRTYFCRKWKSSFLAQFKMFRDRYYVRWAFWRLYKIIALSLNPYRYPNQTFGSDNSRGTIQT